jgi:hypothetical protein
MAPPGRLTTTELLESVLVAGRFIDTLTFSFLSRIANRPMIGLFAFVIAISQ